MVVSPWLRRSGGGGDDDYDDDGGIERQIIDGLWEGQENGCRRLSQRFVCLGEPGSSPLRDRLFLSGRAGRKYTGEDKDSCDCNRQVMRCQQ